ncbi:uncharacterized protein LOC111305527 [Durio zibethinus]|uniref:Uncharacterized protein LOC111305527 n=1 Tax=Durio zibethinus TaxID=66656 RepID=A0A6P6A2C8_DURZI|nr:uncharacterized protein LOC111305527 [Durio zibethinus]XP_022758906.1 uncharacterized protein LOC111305527 [Durio zibethinus]XP_022758914.1 uncharacterized protein LOC111305527 [Durio zibethinus]
MLTLGDIDLNSMQRYTDSLKDIFKQTMLNQEIIFRKQVHELHRLYSVQKTLMKDLALLELEKYNSWKANAQSLPQETRFPTNSVPMVGSTVSLSQELLGGWRCKYHKFQRRPFDLQLLPDQYVSLGDNNIPNKGKLGDYLKETKDVNSLHGYDFSDPLELRLSLSLGAAKGKKEDKQRSCNDKKTITCSGIVIDLEESTEKTSDGDAKHPPLDFAAEVTYSEGKHDSQVAITSDAITSKRTKKDLSSEIAESSSSVGDSKCCQDWSYFDQGLKCHANMPHENFFTGERQFISNGVGHLDLNVAQLEDRSCHSNDAVVALPLTTSSSGGFSGLVSRSQETLCLTTFWRKEITEVSNDSFEMLQHDHCVKLPLMNSNNKDRGTEIQVRNSELSGRNECEKSLIGPASLSRPQINLPKDLGSHSENTKNGRDELMLKLPNVPPHGPNPACVVSTQMGCERIEEGDTVLFCSDKIQITIEDEHPDESPTSGNSSCISDNDSSPVRTMKSGIEPCNSSLPASDQFSGTHGRSQVAETLSGEQDQRSSDSNEIKHECYNNREESAEVDDLIQIAAESLIHISLENSVCYQESSTRTGSNELENEDKEQPQCSADSFELMTLKLTESSADDYSITSKPLEVGDADRKDSSIKLRRGRRLKDFQRDILPGLASLSRHEIREDINILEGVLRSREYRKMRAKMANGESWCTPVRGRRSRLNYVGRKTFR